MEFVKSDGQLRDKLLIKKRGDRAVAAAVVGQSQNKLWQAVKGKRHCHATAVRAGDCDALAVALLDANVLHATVRE